jgi:biotin carboxyl carrier protein
MNDESPEAALDRAERLIPALRDRLVEHGLGEIEVRDDDLRIRVTAARGGRSVAAASSVAPATESRRHEPQPAPAPGNDPVASPGVGYFLYADGLGPGLEVRAGDVIGHVEVLGVRHDVRAPSDGVVRHLVAETGEAVEYGQTLVELERAR